MKEVKGVPSKPPLLPTPTPSFSKMEYYVLRVLWQEKEELTTTEIAKKLVEEIERQNRAYPSLNLKPCSKMQLHRVLAWLDASYFIKLETKGSPHLARVHPRMLPYLNKIFFAWVDVNALQTELYKKEKHEKGAAKD